MIKGLINRTEREEWSQSGCRESWKKGGDERIVHRKKLEIGGGKKEMRGRKNIIVKQAGCDPETLLFRSFERSKDTKK